MPLSMNSLPTSGDDPLRPIAVTAGPIDVALHQARQQLLRHPIYAQVNSLGSLRLFMREHVFAVWDFMSLLKRLQQIVVGSDLPWLPPADPLMTRFLQEIVLGEECDEDGRGGYISHFELYREAMVELGADVHPIDDFLSRLRAGASPDLVLERCPILPTTREFVHFTLQVVRVGQPHEIAAAFYFGREDIIPEMFQQLVTTLGPEQPQYGRLRHYLTRHIELDGDRHGPLSQQLLDSLCAGEAQRIEEANKMALRAIQMRIRLWDGLLAAVSSQAA